MSRQYLGPTQEKEFTKLLFNGFVGKIEPCEVCSKVEPQYVCRDRFMGSIDDYKNLQKFEGDILSIAVSIVQKIAT